MINKLLIPRGELSGIITDESFVIRNDHRAVDVSLCRIIFCYRLRHLRITGGPSSTDAVKFYDRLVHSVFSIEDQLWGLPLHTISMLLPTLQLMILFIRTWFGDSDISYGGISDNHSQDCAKIPYEGPDYGYILEHISYKKIIQRDHSIPLNTPIFIIKKLFEALVFFNDTDTPVKDNPLQWVHKNLQETVLPWAWVVRAMGGTLRPEKCFWKMVDIYFPGGQWVYKNNNTNPTV